MIAVPGERLRIARRPPSSARRMRMPSSPTPSRRQAGARGEFLHQAVEGETRVLPLYVGLAFRLERSLDARPAPEPFDEQLHRVGKFDPVELRRVGEVGERAKFALGFDQELGLVDVMGWHLHNRESQRCPQCAAPQQGTVS